MFGVGAQELVIIVLLLVIVFGPVRVGQIAGEAGRFAYKGAHVDRRVQGGANLR
jgi:Sec-independent protein translocase protein TatA